MKLPVNCVVVTVLPGLNPCMCHAGIEALHESVHDRCGAHFYDKPFLFHQLLTGYFFLSVTLSENWRSISLKKLPCLAIISPGVLLIAGHSNKFIPTLRLVFVLKSSIGLHYGV